MHAAAFQFVKEWGRRIPVPGPVLEIGSLDVNGGVRNIFARQGRPYVGIDLKPGPGVDAVADALTWHPPCDGFACVVCCEVFEHCAAWRDIVKRAAGWLAPGGVLIVTAAGPDRPRHGGDGGPLSDGEHYAAVAGDDLAAAAVAAGLEVGIINATWGAHDAGPAEDVRGVFLKPGGRG